MGKTAKNVSEADALDYVLAYTGANDVRMRDRSILYRVTNPSLGIIPKTSIGSLSVGLLQRVWWISISYLFIGSFLVCAISDNTNPLGPCLVSSTTICDPQQVPLKCTVNGTVLQDGTTAYAFSAITQSYYFDSIFFEQRPVIQRPSDHRVSLPGNEP
jgi:hypothetical protein